MEETSSKWIFLIMIFQGRFRLRQLIDSAKDSSIDSVLHCNGGG